MCPSTVWHLVFHYFVCCEGTINVTFTLKTLLGRVYVQLLTYEDVSVCTTLTLSSRLRTNVLLKTRSHTRAHVFLTKTYLYPFLSYETHVCITCKQCIKDGIVCQKLHAEKGSEVKKSCGCISFQLHRLEIMWQTGCHVLKVTHIHVFLIRKVCRHMSF